VKLLFSTVRLPDQQINRKLASLILSSAISVSVSVEIRILSNQLIRYNFHSQSLYISVSVSVAI